MDINDHLILLKEKIEKIKSVLLKKEENESLLNLKIKNQTLEDIQDIEKILQELKSIFPQNQTKFDFLDRPVSQLKNFFQDISGDKDSYDDDFKIIHHPDQGI